MCKETCNKCHRCKTDCGGCVSSRIDYDNCSDKKCRQKIDAECVIIGLNDINGLSQLPNMGLPNGATLAQVLRRIDTMLGAL